MNAYKCYPPRECALPSGRECKGENRREGQGLCQETPIEVEKRNPLRKKSYLWSTPIDESFLPAGTKENDPYAYVNFLAYDPVEDCAPLDEGGTPLDHCCVPEKCPWIFQTLILSPMDIAILRFNFSGIHPSTYLNSEGGGHYDIRIKSNTTEQGKPFHTLPPYFKRA